MSLQFSEAVRNGRLDQIEADVGASPVLKIFSGAVPANCAAADSGTELAVLALPADWMDPAAAGAKAKAGTWEDTDADAAGTAGHFRIYNTAESVCHMQGTVTATSGGGDMELDNTSIAAGQTITITSFDLTEGNA